MTRHLPRALLGAATAVVLAACASGADSAPTPSPPDSPLPSPTASPSPTVTPEAVIGGASLAEVVDRQDILSGLGLPWDMAFRADGSVLVTLRDSGEILQSNSTGVSVLGGPGAAQITQVLDNTGEGGLLGIAVHPEHDDLIYVYVTRTADNAVLRMRLSGTELSVPREVVTGIPRARIHNGGRIAFGPDGHLYITTGDVAVTRLSQDLDSLAGKILRVSAPGDDTDGQAAPGNPFGTLIYSFGHRNVQGLGWVADGRMYASELGANDRDELNLIVAGANYGWPDVEGMSRAPSGTQLGDTVGGFTYPVAEWSTSEASPSGVAVTNEAIYVAALRGERVWRIPLTTTGIGTPHVLIDDVGRVRHVEIGPDGALYILTNNAANQGSRAGERDRLLRLEVNQVVP